jgi:hypothetical protein
VVSTASPGSSYTCEPNPNYRPYHPSEDKFPRKALSMAAYGMIIAGMFTFATVIALGAFVMSCLGYRSPDDSRLPDTE